MGTAGTLQQSHFQARRALIEMRSLDPYSIDARTAQLKELKSAQEGVKRSEMFYQQDEDEIFVTWANAWVKLLEEAIEKLEQK